MGECFIMDKKAHFKTGNKCFSSLRGFALGYAPRISTEDEIYKRPGRAKCSVKLPVNRLQ